MQLKNIEEDMIDRITDAVAREMNASRQQDASRYRGSEPSEANRTARGISIDSSCRVATRFDRER